VCTGHCETPWHVLGACADIEAVAARGRWWVRRMRKALEAAGKRVGRRKGCLDASVVTALVELWVVGLVRGRGEHTRMGGRGVWTAWVC
jgi:hypothetical protein